MRALLDPCGLANPALPVVATPGGGFRHGLEGVPVAVEARGGEEEEEEKREKEEGPEGKFRERRVPSDSVEVN